MLCRPVQLRPTPIRPEAYLNAKIASSFTQEQYCVVITGLNGKLMLRKTTTVGKGETIIPVSIAQEPPAGFLFIKDNKRW